MLSPDRQVWCRAIVWLSLLPLVACGGSSSSSGGGQHVTVAISGAPPPSIGVGANWQYTATVTGSTNQNVSWTATAGTIDANTGLYIAPNSVSSSASVTITATAQADSSQTASTTVMVQANDPLGTVVSYTNFGTCPSGGLSSGTCFQLQIACPGVSNFSAYLKVYTPTGTPIGTVLFGVGTGGNGLYEDPNTGYAYGSTTVGNILNAGYNTVQISFGSPFNQDATPRGWLTGPGGVRRLACRYATVADWVYHNPTVINPNVTAANSAPMCATGNSGGSAALTYAAYEYGLSSELAMIEPTSGPVMSRIDQGCQPCSSSLQGNVCPGSNNNPNLCYESADAAIIDEAYQAPGAATPTPCTDALNGNPGTDASSQFLSDSILYAGNQSVAIPSTVFKVLLADDDTSNAVPQATLFEGVVVPSPSSPLPLFQCLPGVQHDIPSFLSGAQQVASDVIQYCK